MEFVKWTHARTAWYQIQQVGIYIEYSLWLCVPSFRAVFVLCNSLYRTFYSKPSLRTLPNSHVANAMLYIWWDQELIIIFFQLPANMECLFRPGFWLEQSFVRERSASYWFVPSHKSINWLKDEEMLLLPMDNTLNSAFNHFVIKNQPFSSCTIPNIK